MVRLQFGWDGMGLGWVGDLAWLHWRFAWAWRFGCIGDLVVLDLMFCCIGEVVWLKIWLGWMFCFILCLVGLHI